MTRFAPLWQQGGSYPATLDRSLLALLFPAGGATGAPPAAVANTMNVNIPVGSAMVALQAGQGAAFCRWDAPEVVTVAAAPPSGQSRIDLVVCQVRDDALDGGGNNDFVFEVVQGPPAAANPATPATPANAYAMVAVTVPGGSANLNAAPLSDLRGALGVGVPSGTLADYAGAAAPPGWLLCDGAARPTTQYPALFAAIGYAYGGAGGTFNVPDLRGRVGVGVGGPGGNNAPGVALGAVGGEANHVLTAAEMPSHSHQVTGVTAGSNTNTTAYASGANNYLQTGNLGNATSNTGGNATHNNMPPYVGVTKIIKT